MTERFDNHTIRRGVVIDAINVLRNCVDDVESLLSTADSFAPGLVDRNKFKMSLLIVNSMIGKLTAEVEEVPNREGGIDNTGCFIVSIAHGPDGRGTLTLDHRDGSSEKVVEVFGKDQTRRARIMDAILRSGALSLPLPEDPLIIAAYKEKLRRAKELRHKIKEGKNDKETIVSASAHAAD